MGYQVEPNEQEPKDHKPHWLEDSEIKPPIPISTKQGKGGFIYYYGFTNNTDYG